VDRSREEQNEAKNIEDNCDGKCITGWHDEAIKEKQRQMARKDVDQLSIIYQHLNAMRQGAEVHQ
jgi:hypothetical protein